MAASYAVLLHSTAGGGGDTHHVSNFIKFQQNSISHLCARNLYLALLQPVMHCTGVRILLTPHLTPSSLHAWRLTSHQPTRTAAGTSRRSGSFRLKCTGNGSSSGRHVSGSAPTGGMG